jgi:molybdopterin converting factor small subunit
VANTKGFEDKKIMSATIELKLFAGLQVYKPESAEAYPIQAGTTIQDLLRDLAIPETKAKLIFVNGIKADLDTGLKGGERVGIFPPVGGG